MTVGFAAGALIGLSGVGLFGLWWVVSLRRRHGGAMPLPGWLIRVEHASPELRGLVAKMARTAARDVMQEWDTVPPGLKIAIRREIAQMVAEAFAIHTGRRN